MQRGPGGRSIPLYSDAAPVPTVPLETFKGLERDSAQLVKLSRDATLHRYFDIATNPPPEIAQQVLSILTERGNFIIQRSALNDVRSHKLLRMLWGCSPYGLDEQDQHVGGSRVMNKHIMTPEYYLVFMILFGKHQAVKPYYNEMTALGRQPTFDIKFSHVSVVEAVSDGLMRNSWDESDTQSPSSESDLPRTSESSRHATTARMQTERHDHRIVFGHFSPGSDQLAYHTERGT
ncbi:hypothetical protein LIA77_00931 [Sarocladium implicatum]|nr:hypothetical protein LIA77_00931 [Sarocladium implicatum]